MVVRGAPAIGVTAAYGCWLALRQAMAQAGPGWRVRLDELLRGLENARPTAVNLRWAVELMRAEAKAAGDIGPEPCPNVAGQGQGRACETSRSTRPWAGSGPRP
jgi:methylthioribose-1-phosphate isomerase